MCVYIVFYMHEECKIFVSESAVGVEPELANLCRVFTCPMIYSIRFIRHLDLLQKTRKDG